MKNTHTQNSWSSKLVVVSMSFGFFLAEMNSSAQTEFSVTNNSSCDYWIRYGYDTNCSAPYTFTSGYIQVQASATYTATIPAGEEVWRSVVAEDNNGMPWTIVPNSDYHCINGNTQSTTHTCFGTNEIENTGPSIKIEPQ